MRLWLLRPLPAVLAREAHPWEPPFDKKLGLVVRAKDEASARGLAQAQAGNEGLGIYRKLGAHEEEGVGDLWLDPSWTAVRNSTRKARPRLSSSTGAKLDF